MTFTFALLFFLLAAMPVLAVPTFDAETSTRDFNVTGTSHAHTVGGSCSSSNNIIVVSVGSYVDGGANVSALTIGGVGATLITELVADSRRLELWYRKGVSTGSNTIAVTVDTTVDGINTSARSYCSVDQTTPFGTATATADVGNMQPTIDVASAAGDLVIDAIVSRLDVALTLTVGASQTQRYNDTAITGGFYIHAESDELAVGNPTTMSWTQTGGDDAWYMIGVALKPAAAAPARRRVVVVQ